MTLYMRHVFRYMLWDNLHKCFVVFRQCDFPKCFTLVLLFNSDSDYNLRHMLTVNVNSVCLSILSITVSYSVIPAIKHAYYQT